MPDPQVTKTATDLTPHERGVGAAADFLYEVDSDGRSTVYLDTEESCRGWAEGAIDAYLNANGDTVLDALKRQDARVYRLRRFAEWASSAGASTHSASEVRRRALEALSDV